MIAISDIIYYDPLLPFIWELFGPLFASSSSPGIVPVGIIFGPPTVVAY